MPNMVIPDEGIAPWLADALNGTGAGPLLPWQCLLWKNDYTPDHATTLAALTECDFNGYMRLAVARGVWTPADVLNGCGVTTAGTVPLKWNVNAPDAQIVYGYALYDPTTSKLRAVQRFDPDDIGDLLTTTLFQLLPTITLTSAACAGITTRRTPRRPKNGRQ